jgi:2-polyprenyl-6-methoxyphenol hydroxylase-like FAD-dependent oxidoreductase
MREREGQAVVLGASMAGLLAARVLADLYDTVVIIERDHLPAHPEQRRGVPQGKQIHGLLTGGQRVLEELLPGLTAELAADGAPVVDALADIRLSFNGHRLHQATSGLTHVSASRPLLEHHIRERTRSMPKISVVDATEVIALIGQHGRVNGVRVLRRGSRRAENVDADLVVDACGRGSRTSAWLTELGYPTPPMERIPIDLGYTTRRFHLPADVLDGDVGVLHSPTPSQPRGAALARLENDIWMLTLVGVQADHPPADIDGYSAFAASVGCEEIHTSVRAGEPIDNPISFRFPASVRRRYERVRMPWNLIVLGDSLCSFNPVYGQGMTVAALEAHALRDGLSGDQDPASKPVMASLARIVDVPWQLAKAADQPFLMSPEANRHRSTLLDRYVERVLIAATYDPAAGRAFLRVSGLLDPPQALFQPNLVWRTLRPPPVAAPPRRTVEPPADAGPMNARDQSPWWLFGVIGAAALLKPTLVTAGIVAATTWVRAMRRRHGPPERFLPPQQVRNTRC